MVPPRFPHSDGWRPPSVAARWRISSQIRRRFSSPVHFLARVYFEAFIPGGTVKRFAWPCSSVGRHGQVQEDLTVPPKRPCPARPSERGGAPGTRPETHGPEAHAPRQSGNYPQAARNLTRFKNVLGWGFISARGPALRGRPQGVARSGRPAPPARQNRSKIRPDWALKNVHQRNDESADSEMTL